MSDDQRTRVAPVVRELLASYAGARQRAVDDHMFAVTRNQYRVGAFRLQLFIAPGTRLVVAATQIAGEGGSLTNRAARRVAAISGPGRASGAASADRASEIVLAGDLPHEEQWALAELLSDGTGIQVSRGDDWWRRGT